MSAFDFSGARLARLALAALVLSATAACGDDDDPGSTNGNLPGTYTLRTVDGVTVPLFTDCGDDAIATCTASRPDWERLDGATIVLSGNGTSGSFTLTLNYTDRTSNGTPQSQPFPIAGTYAVSGSTVTLTSTIFGTEGSVPLSHVGDELRGILDLDADFDDDSIIFKKQ